MGNKRIVIGLVGESGSGKDTVAKYLAEKYGAKLMRFADPVKETLNIYFEQSSREDQQWLAMEFRKRFGADILPRAIKKKIDSAEGLVVINGIRFWEDYDFVKKTFGGYVFYITLDQETRWGRTFGRGEKADDSVSFEKFQETEKAETEIHIPEIGAKADFTINNEKDLKHLHNSVDEVMEKIIK